MLMPSHARNVQLYKDSVPVFSRNGVEAQLDAMFSPQVTLKSGGYIVINQTEALVSIDVNSGPLDARALDRGHGAQHQSRSGRGDRPPASPARPRRPHRHRLHRHGGEAQQPLGRAQAEGLPARRPRAHPGRAHLAFRPDGDVAPAHPHRRARKLDRPLPALPRHRPGAVGLVAVAADSARARGSSPAPQRTPSSGAHAAGSGALRAQPEAPASGRARGAFRTGRSRSAASRRRTAPASRSSAARRSRSGRSGTGAVAMVETPRRSRSSRSRRRRRASRPSARRRDGHGESGAEGATSAAGARRRRGNGDDRHERHHGRRGRATTSSDADGETSAAEPRSCAPRARPSAARRRGEAARSAPAAPARTPRRTPARARARERRIRRAATALRRSRTASSEEFALRDTEGGSERDDFRRLTTTPSESVGDAHAEEIAALTEAVQREPMPRRITRQSQNARPRPAEPICRSRADAA